MKCVFIVFQFIMLGAINIFAQSDSVFNLSLKQAQEYAIENSPAIKNSKLDMDAAKKKVWETTTIGLPQASSSFLFSYTPSLPASIEQFSQLGSLFGGDSTESVNVNDYKWSAGLDITISQLIFNGNYIVGLQTSKTYKALSEIALTKSLSDLKESVTNTYFLVLTTSEGRKTVDTLYNNTEKLYFETQAMYKEGFVEESNVDQLKLAVSNLRNLKDNLARQEEIVIRLLKFQIGMNLDAHVNLTDQLSDLVDIEGLLDYTFSEFIPENYADFQLLQKQEALMNLNLKLQKSNILPNIAGFYQYHKQLNNSSFDFQAPSTIGIQASMPLFASGQNLVKIKQAQIELEKTRNEVNQAESGLILDFETAKSEYLSALDNYTTQKENMETAGKIYNNSILKFKEGMIGGMDLTDTQNQYLNAETQFFQSVNQLAAAKSKIEKMLNKN